MMSFWAGWLALSFSGTKGYPLTEGTKGSRFAPSHLLSFSLLALSSLWLPLAVLQDFSGACSGDSDGRSRCGRGLVCDVTTPLAFASHMQAKLVSLQTWQPCPEPDLPLTALLCVVLSTSHQQVVQGYELAACCKSGEALVGNPLFSTSYVSDQHGDTRCSSILQLHTHLSYPHWNLHSSFCYDH